jgi:hypothetical protein
MGVAARDRSTGGLHSLGDLFEQVGFGDLYVHDELPG